MAITKTEQKMVNFCCVQDLSFQVPVTFHRLGNIVYKMKTVNISYCNGNIFLYLEVKTNKWLSFY